MSRDLLGSSDSRPRLPPYARSRFGWGVGESPAEDIRSKFSGCPGSTYVDGRECNDDLLDLDRRVARSAAALLSSSLLSSSSPRGCLRVCLLARESVLEPYPVDPLPPDVLGTGT